MTFEELQAMWGEDSKIDLANLNYHSAESHHLLSKYLNLRSQERLTLAALEMETVRMKHLRKQWYLGEIPLDKLKELGWIPNAKKIIKMDVAEYLEADEMIIKHVLKVAVSKEKVSFIEDVVKALTYRSSTIKNIIDNKRFESGDRGF